MAVGKQRSVARRGGIFMKLILASNSPRRKELLKKEGFEFEVIVGDYEEKSFTADPYKTAVTFAEGKARAVFSGLENDEKAVVVGADTVVFSDGKILGKPKDKEDAEKTLKSLSDKTHEVITGYAVITENGEFIDYDQTYVTFNTLTESVLKSYIASGLWKGKAGGYGIQDGYPLVKSYDGSLNNVIGLPTEKITPILKKLIK